MQVVIIIPTYNERENIKPLIEALEACLPARQACLPAGREHTILVVDDNSPDGTAEIVKKAIKQKNKETKKPRSRRVASLRGEQENKIAILEGEKEGIGSALQRGIDYAIKNLGAEVIVQMDADFSHDPKDVPRLLAEIENGCDLAIGSRYIKGGAIPSDWAIHRKIFSVGGNLLVRLMTGIWDVHEFTTNFRAFTAELYQKMNRENFDFADNTFLPAFIVEARRCRAKIKEVPIVFSNRKKGKSKIAVARYVPSLLKFCLQNLFVFGKIRK